jgi:hypothetical protein
MKFPDMKMNVQFNAEARFEVPTRLRMARLVSGARQEVSSSRQIIRRPKPVRQWIDQQAFPQDSSRRSAFRRNQARPQSEPHQAWNVKQVQTGHHFHPMILNGFGADL